MKPLDKHCRADARMCRGADYCACQCDGCFEAWRGRPRTDEERAMGDPLKPKEG